MSTRTAIFSLILILLGLSFTIPAASKADADIIVNNADLIRTESHSGGIPVDLQAELSKVTDRIIVEYANNIRHTLLTNIPNNLASLLEDVPVRIIMLYANGNREMSLVYPLAFFNDSTPPKISQVTASAATSMVSWMTDEFATSIVLYGTQSGSYDEPVGSTLYAKEHEVILPDLKMGVRYYYKVRSTDRSGNTSTSEEFSFINQINVYLPLLIGDK